MRNDEYCGRVYYCGVVGSGGVAGAVGLIRFGTGTPGGGEFPVRLPEIGRPPVAIPNDLSWWGNRCGREIESQSV